jgi:hypothetical protein
MLVKTYERDSGKKALAEVSYSPAECTGSYAQRITGEPDGTYISISYAERQNLTMRMRRRRFTRLTNAFSKKVDNHKAAEALHFTTMSPEFTSRCGSPRQWKRAWPITS